MRRTIRISVSTTVIRRVTTGGDPEAQRFIDVTPPRVRESESKRTTRATGLAIVLAVVVLLAIVSPLWSADGELKISPTTGISAGVPTTFSWSGTLQPPATGSVCGELQTPEWTVASPSTGGLVQTAKGNSATFTLRLGGWYDVVVNIRYPGCEGGGSGGVRVLASGSIFNFVTTQPDPAFVDQVTGLNVTGNIPNDARADWTFGDGTSCNDCMIFDHGNAFYSHTWTTPGTYDARVTITTPAGSPTPVSESKTLRVVVKADPPTASAGFTPSNPTAGQSVQFTGVVGGGERDRTFEWDFGDGTTSNVLNPAHTFAAADDYDVSFTVRNAWGTAKWLYPLTVLAASGGTPPTSSTFSWTPPSPVTQQLVSFVDESKGTITRWRWSFDDGSPKVYTKNPTHTFTQPGRRNVELHVSNAFGSKAIVLFVDVLRNDVPPVGGFNFTPFRVHVGEPVQFTDTSFGGTSWQWDLGEDGAMSTQQNPRYTYRTTGQKSVTLRVSNAFGSDTVTKFFPCDEGTTTVLAANFTWSPLQPNPGQAVQFTDLSTGSPEKWSWVVSDGAQSNERNFTHTFLEAGDYAVSLRIDKGSETKIFVQTIRVGTTAAPIPNFTFSPGSPAPNEPVKFVNLSQNATSYVWDFNDGATSTEVEPTHAFAAEQTYRVKLTAKTGSASATTTKSVIVAAAGTTIPVAHFEVDPNPALVGKPVSFTDTSTGRPTAWLWDFGYSNLTSTLQNPEHTFPFEGTFLVRLTVTNAKGSSQPLTLPVVVKKDLPKPVADFTWLPGTPAALEVVTFTDNSSNSPKEWRWTFADGGSATGSVVTHTFAKAGNWNVSLTVSNAAGEATTTRTVVVTEKKLQADFAFTPSKPKSGDVVRFTDSSKGDPESWKWVVDGIEAGEERNLTRTFYEGGEHVVELEVRRGTDHASTFKEFVVAAPPVASFRIGGKLNTGVVILFTDNSAGRPTKRTWFIDGKNAGGEPTISRTFRDAGTYFVRLLVENENGSDSVARSIYISASLLERPVIRSLKPAYGPCFFAGMPLTTDATIDVDWRQQLPNSIDEEINGTALSSTKAESATTILKLRSEDLDFSDRVTENQLLFTARGSLTLSDAAKLTFFGVKTPGYVRLANVRREILEPGRRTFVRGLYLPAQPFEGGIQLPEKLGGFKFGLKNVQFKVDSGFRTDCMLMRSVAVSGGMILGTEGSSTYGGLTGSGSSETKISRTSGSFDSQEMSFALGGFVGAETSISVLELLPGMTPLCGRAIIRDLCKAVSVKLEAQANAGGMLDFTIDDEGTLHFKGVNNAVAVQFTATGILGPGSAKLEVFGTGKGSVKFSLFSPPLIRKADVGFEGGARVTLFGFIYEVKDEFTCVYEPEKKFACGFDPASLRIGDGSVMALRPVMPLARTQAVEVASSAVAPGDRSDVLLRNVSSLADPAAAARDDRSIVVYLSENETAGASLQRLDVRSMRRTGTDAWSDPVNVTSDGSGDFNPNVALLPNGRAVAAWERIKNPALSNSDIATLDDLPKLLREVEIAVSSELTPSSWSTPAMLTSNDLYDHQPALAALSDGRTILVWLREPADGSGAQQIVSRVLQGETWTTESIVATDLRGVNDLALAAKGNEAQLVIAREGDLALFVFRNGAWSTRTDITSDTDDDRSPSIAYDGDVPRVYWTRGDNLVTRLLPAGTIETVRAAADGSAVVTPIAVVRPDGSQSVVWNSGNDLRAVVRDSQTKQWSSDILLTDRSMSHASLSAFFTPDATLHLLSLGTNESQRSDLLSFDLQMHVDLAAHGESIAVEPRQPNPGESVTMRIDLENAGRLAVRDAIVELRRGQAVVATTTIAGDWMPGTNKQTELTTTYDPASPQLTIVVDATGDSVPANNTAQFSFANRAPEACFQASTGSGGTPLAITFDAACSTDVDGRIARFSWAFDDDANANGSSVAHSFATAGPHKVVLTVTDEMGSTSSHSMTIDVASSTDWRHANAENSLYLSVVGRAAGAAGSFFVSDVAILNTDTDRELTIDAVYMPDGRIDTYRTQLTLGGGELLQTRDMLAKLFGATNGAGSVRLDLSQPHAVAVARTYNDQPAGTAGFSNEALTRGAALTDGEKGVILQHWLPGDRTNFGFTEVGGASTIVFVTAVDEKGAALGTEQFPLAPYEHKQINGRPLFQSRGRIEFEVTGGAVLAYVSTVDGKTADPIYQVPERIPAGAAPRPLLIPVVARLSGANNTVWRSDVRVFNPNAAAQEVTIELRTDAGSSTKTFSLAASATASFDDVITNAFPQLTGNVGGSLMISAAAPLLATSRTFNITSSGTYGLYAPARTASELLGTGETAFLVQLQENADYRCNLGLTTIDEPAEILVRAFDAGGATLATKTYSANPGQNKQIGRVLAEMGVSLPITAAGIEVTVLSGRVFVYASINDNRTGDATFVEARR